MRVLPSRSSMIPCPWDATGWTKRIYAAIARKMEEILGIIAFTAEPMGATDSPNGDFFG